MTHLLPGGGVPRVHRARSPVPPRLPHFATPRSVRHLATVVAGAYPLRRPLDAWSPGLLAPPGPCYWLVASGTPMGWRGGCLAVSWCVTLCVLTTALADAVPWLCVGGARGWNGGSGQVPVPASPLGLLPALASLPFACRYAIPRGLCVPRARSGCPSGARRVSVACVCALRVVLVQGAGRAVPGGSCPLRVSCRGPVLRLFHSWGVARPLRHLALLGVARPPAGRPAFVCWLCALWGRHEGARGGRLSPGCGASGVGRSPTPGRPSFGACGRGPLPTGRGCGVRARGPGCPWHFSNGTHLSRISMCIKPATKPHSARSFELALRAAGAARGRPGEGGAPLAWVWGVPNRALSYP